MNATIEDLTTAAGTDAVFGAFYVDNLRTGLCHQIGIVSAEQALGMLERSADSRRLVFSAVTR